MSYLSFECCAITTPVFPFQLLNASDPESQRITSGQFTLIIFSRVFHMLTGFGLSINGKHNYCGDYIYSGHTVSVTISKLTHEAGEPDQSVTDDRFSFPPSV